QSSALSRASGEVQDSYSDATVAGEPPDTVQAQPTFSSSAPHPSEKDPEGRGPRCHSCEIDIHIDCPGEVNIYNCSPTGCGCPQDVGSSTTPVPPSGCFPPVGSCSPAVPGAKHKQGRNRMLANLAARARV